MVLTAQPLKDVQNVNAFAASPVFEFVEDDAPLVYMQLWDRSVGRRYVPAAGATLSCRIESIDDAKVITRAASQPFSGDASIWALQLFSTDSLKGTANLRLTLTEGATVRTGFVNHAFRVTPLNCLADPVTVITGF